ncbi:MAG: dihydrofolate reductase family protein, partial [Actinomycetota bacterium]
GAMSKLRATMAISLDGFGAGPDQSVDNALGVGGERLHEWMIPLAVFREMHGEDGGAGETNASTAVIRGWWENIGAVVMGRNMFGRGSGPWQGDWRGWWGENPPYHVPVFIITHHPREPVEMQGGTTFHFSTEGIETTLKLATEAADGKDVWLTGGASVIRQYLRERLLDEIEISLTPVLLGEGERLFADLGGAGIELEQIRAIEAPGVTHIKYRVKHLT